MITSLCRNQDLDFNAYIGQHWVTYHTTLKTLLYGTMCYKVQVTVAYGKQFCIGGTKCDTESPQEAAQFGH